MAVDSDPFESEGAVLGHKEDNGFEGTFTVGTEELISALQAEFGPEIITPPTSPVVLLSADQSEARLLRRGIKDLDDLQAELAEGP